MKFSAEGLAAAQLVAVGLVADPTDGDELRERAYPLGEAETYEELGITVAPASLAPAGAMFRRSLEPRVDFFFTADEWGGTPRICEPPKCTALAWADPDNLPSGTLEYISAAIANLRQGQHFSEHGWTPAFSQ